MRYELCEIRSDIISIIDPQNINIPLSPRLHVYLTLNLLMEYSLVLLLGSMRVSH